MMRLINCKLLILAASILLISCDLAGPETPEATEAPANIIFSEDGKLTLYSITTPYGLPNQMVFGESIIFDASYFISPDTDVEWEIYYNDDYDIQAGSGASGFTYHDEVVAKGEFVFKPEGSGSYLIKAIVSGGDRVTCDGLIVVTRSPLDNSSAPNAILNEVSVPDQVGQVLELNGNGSTDDNTLSADLEYFWTLYKVNPKTLMYRRNNSSIKYYYDYVHTGISWNKTFTESGLYHIKLTVKDEIYDLARDNESAKKFLSIYVRPAGETVNSSLDFDRYFINIDSDGEASVSMGDMYWFEAVQNYDDFADIIVLYKLTFYNSASGYYYKYYYSTTLNSVPEAKPWDEKGIDVNVDRDQLKTAAIGNLTTDEVGDLESFRVIIQAFDADGDLSVF